MAERWAQWQDGGREAFELMCHFAETGIPVLASWVGALNLLSDAGLRLRGWRCLTSSIQMWGEQAASREQIVTEHLSAGHCAK